MLKDREERVVAIPAQIIPVLKEMKLKATSDFVIDIKEVTHHQLRATHITLALIDGIPLGIVKENGGHAKPSTRDRPTDCVSKCLRKKQEMSFLCRNERIPAIPCQFVLTI